ncbi:MAG TPA: hypothetical protein VFO34_13515 [Candidatus Acidoferrales bacterium]|nr:hypothetical protein [Candidatus Acidoferrales bacterium]
MHLKLGYVLALLLIGILTGGPLSNASEQTSGAASKAVPISSEHHHHLAMENSFVRVYEVEVPAHEATLMHQHDRDYVYIVLGDSDVTNEVQGKSAVKMSLPDTAVNFSKGPFAHIAGNNGEKPFRNVTIELLKPQGEVKSHFPSVNAALAAAKPIAGADGAREALILETNELRVFAVEISGKGVWQPAGGVNRLVLNLYMLNDLIQSGIWPSTAKVGDLPYGLSWFDGAVQQLRGMRDVKMRCLALEFR